MKKKTAIKKNTQVKSSSVKRSSRISLQHKHPLYFIALLAIIFILFLGIYKILIVREVVEDELLKTSATQLQRIQVTPSPTERKF